MCEAIALCDIFGAYFFSFISVTIAAEVVVVVVELRSTNKIKNIIFWILFHRINHQQLGNLI